MTKFIKSPPLASGIIAFLYYTAAISHHAYPGESATAIAEHAGLSPFLPLLHPFYSLLAHQLAILPLNLPYTLNLFSALCAALAVALFCRLTSYMPHAPAEHPDRDRLATIASIISALTLALLPPVAFVATRAHPGSFELLLLVAWLALLQRFAATGRTRWLWATAIFTGPAAVELPAFPAIAAVIAALTLWAIRHRQAQPWRTLTAAAALSLASLAITLIAWAWCYAHLPANAWRENLSPTSALYALAQRQWLATRLQVMGFGWLLTLLMTFAPWLIAAFSVRPPLAYPIKLGHAALCIALLLPPLLLLGNAPLAPWRLFDGQPLFVLPYLFVASTTGLVASLAYLWAKPLRWHPDRWRPFALPTLCILAALILSAAAVRRFPAINARRADVTATWAQTVITTLGPRPWLVTDGVADDLLRIAAHEAGAMPTLLDLSRARQNEYLAYVAAQFSEPRLHLLAGVGLVPLLREWIATDPAIAGKLAILPQPGLWLAAQYAFLPRGTLYLGTRQTNLVDTATLAADEDRMLQQLIAPLQSLARGTDPAARLAHALLQRLARHANNLGLALENLGDPTRAAWAYHQALALQPENICAHLNLFQLESPPPPPVVQSSSLPSLQSSRPQIPQSTNPPITNPQSPMNNAQCPMTLATLEALASRFANTPLPLLTARFGHIRSVEALDLLQAARASASENAAPPPPEIRHALAQLMAHNTNAARATLTALMDRPPAPSAAHVLLGVLAFREGDTNTVWRCISALRARGQHAAPLLIIEGKLHVRNGDTARATQCFARALARDPRHVPALEEWLALALPDAPEAGPLIAQLLALDPGNALGNFALGVRLCGENKNDLAETAFRRSLERHALPDTLNNLAWLMQARGASAAALPLVQDALRQESHDAASWDTLGVILMRLGRPEEARDALERALRLQPDAKETQQHLAALRARRIAQ